MMASGPGRPPDPTRSARPQRSAAAAVLGVSVIQLVVFLVTAGFWMGLVFNTSGRCETACDWAAGQSAAAVFFGCAAASFVITIVALIISRRTGTDLAWVPLVASALIVVGYLVGARLFTQAMG